MQGIQKSRCIVRWIAAAVLGFVLVLGFLPGNRQAYGEETVIDLNTLTNGASGSGWSYSGNKLLLEPVGETTVFRIKGDGIQKSMRIRLGDWLPFRGTVILENVNIINMNPPGLDPAAMDCANESTVRLRLIGDSCLESREHAGININGGNLTIEAYDDTPSSLIAIGGKKANGIGTGEDNDFLDPLFRSKPHVSITGNCMVTVQGTQNGYALGAQSLTMDDGAKLILNNPANPARGLGAYAVKDLSDCTIGGNAAGALPMSVAPAGLDFGSQSIPYSQPEAQQIAITYWGENSVTLTQPASAKCTVTALSTTTLVNGATATFTVRPNADLPEGIHDETIIINGSNGAAATVPVRFKVTDPPTVTAVTPANAATGVGVSGNIEITFSKPIHTAGTVSLDGGNTMLGTEGAGWDSTRTVYAVSYSGLTWETQYTITIAGFRNAAGNPMIADSSFSFTTKAEPEGPDADRDGLSIITGGSKTFTVSLGQSGNEAVQAIVTSADSSIAAVSYSPVPIVVSGSAITVTGVSAGSTFVYIDFSGGSHNGGSGSRKTVSVTVTDPQPVTHSVTVMTDGNGRASAAPVSAAAGTVIELTATPDRNYSFSHWESISPAALAISGNRFTMPEEDVIVKAHFNYSGGNSDSGSYTYIPSSNTTGSITVFGVSIPYTIENATGIMTASLTAELLDKILAAAGENETVVLEAGGQANVREAVVNFPPSWFEGHERVTFVLQSGIGGIHINNNLAGKFPVSNRTATVSLRKGSLILLAEQDGKAVTWNTAEAPVVIYMPYTPEADTDTNTVVLYDKAAGKAVVHSLYAGGKVYGAVNKPGEYDVKSIAHSFTDTAAHWAKDDIAFAVSRGLLTGIDGAFLPETAITRADFAAALGKLSGADIRGYTSSSFTDVADTSPAMPYIEWAVENKIVTDISGGKFKPGRKITREQMALMMVNYAKATGQALPINRQAAAFTDHTKISTWAKKAVKAVQWAGIITGKSGSLFDPQGRLTRAGASTILRRFAEGVVSTTIDGYTVDGDGVRIRK